MHAIYRGMMNDQSLKRNKQLLVLVNSDEWDLIEASARTMGWTKSEIVRYSTLAYLMTSNEKLAEKAKAAGDLETAEHAMQAADVCRAVLSQSESTDSLRERTRKYLERKEQVSA